MTGRFFNKGDKRTYMSSFKYNENTQCNLRSEDGEKKTIKAERDEKG